MKNIIIKPYEVVVAGGGMAGFCAAIAAAREGARTALVHDRPVLGGNASSEIRVGILGADCHVRKKDARETGIVEEVLLENKKRNNTNSFSVFDLILWEKANFQENLDLYLNTHITEAECEDNHIRNISAIQLTSETTYKFEAEIYIDCTGDGALGMLSGAEFSMGEEAKEAFGEPDAPDAATSYTMGNSIQFTAVDKKEPAAFEKPSWAYEFSEQGLKDRPHHNMYPGRTWHGYWWFEHGGGKYNTIADAETIRDELLKNMFGVWDHIKNGGDHGAENYAMDWIQFLPGKRESRRLTGDYIMREQDILTRRIFDDAVAYGGWPVDSHAPDSIMSLDKPPILKYINFDGVYTIPYRCLYSRNVDNLMMAGRPISGSHLACSSTRVMGTASLTGQAAGTAAAVAVKKKTGPRGVGNYIGELQQTLLKNDCYIPGVINRCEEDKARYASVTASSHIDGCFSGNIINGKIRNENGVMNCWVSEDIGNTPQWISLSLDQPVQISEMIIRFDSDLNQEIVLTMDHRVNDRQSKGTPPTIIKDYAVEMRLKGKIVHTFEITGNYQRFCRHTVDKILCDFVKVIVKSTNGDKKARIFEIRLNV